MKTLNIPIALLQYILIKNLSKPFSLYLALKFRCDGVIVLSEEDKRLIALKLGYKSVKSIDNNIQRLIRLNWIGYNSKTGNYFVRGFERIRSQYGFYNRRSGEILENDIVEIQAFAFSCIVQNLICVNKRRYRNCMEGVAQKRAAIQPSRNSNLIAVRAIARTLNKSTSFVHRMKQKAIELGYISAECNLIMTDYPLDIIHSRKAMRELGFKARVIGDRIYLRDSDTITTCIRIRRRKKIEQY